MSNAKNKKCQCTQPHSCICNEVNDLVNAFGKYPQPDDAPEGSTFASGIYDKHLHTMRVPAPNPSPLAPTKKPCPGCDADADCNNC